MTSTTTYPLEGGCDCAYIRYRLLTTPLIVHCCHCRWCQRESGSAFALNAVFEHSNVVCISGEPDMVEVPSESGTGQIFARCPKCKIAVWSKYDGTAKLSYVRVGTLDQPDHVPPDVHIYTASKQPWVVLPEDKTAVKEYYRKEDVWSEESLKRLEVLKGR